VTKVLYIEHDDDNLYMLKMRLERVGDFEVLASDDSEQGCRLALTERPDVILHAAGPRLCRWLLQCADRTGRDELPLTQEYLAQMLGVRRTTVTLLAQALQVRGVISYRRGHIVLLDRKGLEECAWPVSRCGKSHRGSGDRPRLSVER
jgi:hypothetical protein